MSKIDLSQVITVAAAAAVVLAARRSAADVVSARVEARLLALTGPVPMDEKLSWTTKEDASRRFLASKAPISDPDALALLTIEAEQTGEPVADLAGRILGKAVDYRRALAQQTGWRRAAMLRIEGAATPQELDLILAEVLALPDPV